MTHSCVVCFQGRLNELMSQLRMHNQLGTARADAATAYQIDPSVQAEIRQVRAGICSASVVPRGACLVLGAACCDIHTPVCSTTDLIIHRATEDIEALTQVTTLYIAS